jgi:hypothetical protein
MFPRAIILAGLVALLALQLHNGDAASRVTTLSYGSEVPDTPVVSMKDRMRRLSLRDLTQYGCGHVYIFDTNCPYCMDGISSSGERRVPREPLPGADFMLWLGVDTNLADATATLDSHVDAATVYFLDRSSGSPAGGLAPSVPRIWKVQDGRIIKIIEGRQGTSAHGLHSDNMMSCEEAQEP